MRTKLLSLFLTLATAALLLTGGPSWPTFAPIVEAQNTALNRTVAVLLTNKSGGALTYGDVVVIDTTTDSSFTTTTTSGISTKQVGVILEPSGIANNASGMVATGGWVPKVNLNTASTRGQFLKTHTVAGQATPHSSPQVEGDFGVALEASTTPKAILFGGPSPQGSGTTLTLAGASGDIQTNNGAGNLGSITPASGIATFLATPSGANLATALTSALTVAKGGTGQTSYTDGQLLIGNTGGGNTLTKATLTAGSGVTVTNGGGTITLGGKVAQTVTCLSTAVNTGSTQIPIDDTIPQNTEGDEYMTCAITPANSSSTLVITSIGVFSNSSASRSLTMALFQDTTANALAATVQFAPTAAGIMTIPLTHTMTAGTTSSTTFKIREGTNTTGTNTFNGFSSGRAFGAITKSSMVITEYLP